MFGVISLKKGVENSFLTKMPRRSSSSSRGSSARSAPAKSSVPAQQAAPQVPAVNQPVQQKAPGMLSQIASVAVGSTVGHVVGSGISNMIFGGSSNHAQQPQQQAAAQDGAVVSACEADQKAFMRCLESNKNDIGACQIYLDMFKECQAKQQF
jgi:hypothetical protein